MKRITVFTATYNRANFLPRLFDSLSRQSFTNFEWVVIDDGSTDSTSEVMCNLINKKPFFEIKYKKTENGGKHRAINRGMELVNGELFLIMDSDDILRDDALQIIDFYEKTITKSQKSNYAGVYGLRVHFDGTIVGKTFDGEYLDCTYLERNKNNIIGDKCEVYYSYLLKKIPFPEYEGELFCTECLVWDEIGAMGLKIRFFNEGIYISDYLNDGLTTKGNILYAKNPKQYGQYVNNQFRFKKTDWFHSSIKVYEYYLYEKNTLSFSCVVSYLHLNCLEVITCIAVQWVADIFRYILKKRITIRKNVCFNIMNNE